MPTSPLASSSSSISGAKGPARAVESTKETYKHWRRSATNKRTKLDSRREANHVTHHFNYCPSMLALLCVCFLLLSLLLTFFVGTRIGKRRSLWSFSVEFGEEQGGPTNCKTTPVFKKMFLTNATNRLHVNFSRIKPNKN